MKRVQTLPTIGDRRHQEGNIGMKDMRDLSSEVSWFDHKEMEGADGGRVLRLLKCVSSSFLWSLQKELLLSKVFSEFIGNTCSLCKHMLPLIQSYTFIYGHYARTTH